MTLVNHVGTIAKFGVVPLVVEALFRVRIKAMAVAYLDRKSPGGKDGLIVVRPLAPPVNAEWNNSALDWGGRSYGYGKLLLHLLDWFPSMVLGRDIYLFRRFTVLSTPICSRLVELLQAPRGVTFGGHLGSGSPDSMLDYVMANRDSFEVVYVRAGGAITDDIASSIWKVD